MHSHEINEHRTSNPRVGSSNLSERATSVQNWARQNPPSLRLKRILLKFQDRFAGPYLGEKGFGIELVIGDLRHGSLPWSD
jgi:hypothetical protein